MVTRIVKVVALAEPGIAEHLPPLGAGIDADLHGRCRESAFAGFSFGPHFPPMFYNDPLNNGQPHSCSLKLLITMQSLKYAE